MDTKNEDIKVVKNHDLNEDAEYAGNKQDLEQMLLDAQRYLNIFHQIHIFNDRRKKEFEKSLIEMPDKLRSVLINLPGGRVLVEHIEDCEVKRGLRKERTIFGNENQIVKDEKISEISAIKNKEFTKELAKTIVEAVSECNKNMFQMNEKILQDTLHNSGNEASTVKQAKVLADALRENNKQQMEMIKTFGSTLSQTILRSQKEIFASTNNNHVADSVRNQPLNKEMSVVDTTIHKGVEVKNNVTSMPKKVIIDKSSLNNMSGKSDKNIKTSEPVIQESISQSLPKTEYKGIDSEQIVKTVEQNNDKFSQAGIDNTLADGNDTHVENSEKSTPKVSFSFVPALQKIKNALTESAKNESDNIKDMPVSLSKNDDDLSKSFSQAFSETESKPVYPSANTNTEEKWEYVDEDGNPIDPNEWEYVDENGNPIDPNEWEYVDENGNPINPDEWEYVDENGNPIAK